MIWRIWFLVSVVGIAGAWLLAVPFSPEPTSLSASNIADYRDGGLVPAAGGFTIARDVGHEIFEMPAEDADHRREAAAASGALPGMEGMAMGQPAEADGTQSMAMTAPAGHETAEHDEPDLKAAQPVESMAMGVAEKAENLPMPVEQTEGGHGGGEMAGMTAEPDHEEAMGHAAGEAAAEHGEPDMKAAQPVGSMAMGVAEKAESLPMPVELTPGGHDGEEMAGMTAGPGHEEEAGHGAGGAAAGISILALGSPEEVAERLMHGAVDRTIEIAMDEWRYDPPRITVQAGEVVRFVVRNAGRTPHEFMLMTGPGMAAVNYRIERADWNLLEHEAITEVPVVLPGDSFELVARIHGPGNWMFMCMFPYHMQLGMMGMVMTEGMAMDGGMDMKM